ncbi:hypothetical protein [Muricoccus radiodurans]|uniref:hypothetical protein n=1 Tax=Muricoccus radiodurans TaxID=2231721 RepID=UPI003CE827A7
MSATTTAEGVGNADTLPDAALLGLLAAFRRAQAWEKATRSDWNGTASSDPSWSRVAAAHASAVRAWHDVLRRIAATPVEGVVGLAIKAGIIAAEASAESCMTADDVAVVRSLEADLARLMPQAVAV